MRIQVLSIIFLTIMLSVIIVLGIGCSSGTANRSEQLYQKAKKLEETGNYTRAGELYKETFLLLSKENQPQLLQLCREGGERIAIFQSQFPYTKKQIRTLLTQTFPDVPEQQVDIWITSGEIGHYKWDGKEHYDINTPINILFSHLDLLQANQDVEKAYRDFFQEFCIEFIKPAIEWSVQPYQQPSTFRGTHTLNIPRNKLPVTGTFQIWFPLPINSGPQSQVVVESISPDIYVKQSPDVNGDIGLLYMEVPLEQLQTDLNIQVKFTFTHYQQKFNVDPAKIGDYNKVDPQYLEYTESRGNIQITPEIKTLALEIAGNEKNPYLAARAIYNYIVNNIDYAFMPHNIMWPRTPEVESAYVQQYRRGDCGAQSIYFCALCRALGIPARCAGGWQQFNGQFADHFWAEFYLPDYGWIPVDTSVARMGLYPKDIPEDERQEYIEYFFGNQDSLRCTIQVDVDEPLAPPANGMILLPIVIQHPTGLCSTLTDNIPGILLAENWKIDCEQITTGR